MAFAFKASCHVYTVCSIFNGVEKMKDVHPSRARHLDHFYVGRIGQSHGTCQVPGCIRSVLAAKSDYPGFKFLGHH
jgi:hypothetical protein